MVKHTEPSRKGATIVEGVFFDLWSTLLEEKPGSPFYSAIANRFQVDLQRFMEEYKACGEDFMLGVIPNLSSRVYTVCQKVNTNISFVAVDEVVNDLVTVHLDNVVLYPDTIQVLSQLKSVGIKLGIISNASSWSEMVLDSVGIRPYFDSIVLSYKYGIVKPTPAIYLQGLMELGLDSQFCCFVGDGGDNEMEGAKNVGLTTILVDRYSRNVQADYRVNSLSDAVITIITGNHKR